ncbi:MAG: hypothetical protein D6723_11215 [Acidobacteria bacterium]|nr:MAG: hypothetical protein D6723_11215 [Acidobacteriota bacterium]
MMQSFHDALMITGFVFAMMLVIEYLNVLTMGEWQRRIARHRWGQLLLAAFLGAIPGCLGAFVVVTMYAHGIVTLGAVVAAMIATSGDEAFVMLALIPHQAILLTGILLILGVTAGALTDMMARRRLIPIPITCEGVQWHMADECQCFPRGHLRQQWRECSLARGVLAVALGLFIVAILTGRVGPAAWNWMRITMLMVTALSLFIVATVPDHFLEEHLWQHVARRHIPRLFLWTLGALVAIHVLMNTLHLEANIREAGWLVLLGACLIGLIPESGPHLLFVTLYAQGVLPLSILLASSIVQDGHGMLPMLAHSRRDFIVVKAINFFIGLGCGAIGLALGW